MKDTNRKVNKTLYAVLTLLLGTFGINKFYAGKDGIRCPLSIINGVGTSISNDIISERENGKFTDPIDFIVRMSNKGINKKTISSLILQQVLKLLVKHRLRVFHLVLRFLYIHHFF